MMEQPQHPRRHFQRVRFVPVHWQHPNKEARGYEMAFPGDDHPGPQAIPAPHRHWLVRLLARISQTNLKKTKT